MENFTRIAVLDNEVEACLLGSILTDRQIPHTIQSYHDDVFDGVYQLQKGWGCIVGPEEKKDEILEILNDLRENAEPPTEQ